MELRARLVGCIYNPETKRYECVSSKTLAWENVPDFEIEMIEVFQDRESIIFRGGKLIRVPGSLDPLLKILLRKR